MWFKIRCNYFIESKDVFNTMSFGKNTGLTSDPDSDLGFHDKSSNFVE